MPHDSSSQCSQRPATSAVLVAATALLALITTGTAVANPSGVSLDVPGVAMKNSIIRIEVSASGSSEGIWFHTTGLEFQRGWFDHCGWCGKPCLVSDEIQSCPSDPDGCCFDYYCLGCTWDSNHEWSNGDYPWYGPPTWEFRVTGCDTATIQAEYSGGQHEGPFLLPEHEIIVLDGIEAAFAAAPDDACVGEEVSFDASDTCGGTDFRWSFGDGASGDGKLTTHSYHAAGLYTVVLDVTSPVDGGQATGTVHVSADCATIEGTVTDAADASSLGGVLVVADSVPHTRAALSDPAGRYQMIVPPGPTYTLHTSRAGYYDSAPATASPGPGETVIRNFALLPEVTDPIDPLAVLGGQWINVGDPVNPATGNFTFSRSLLAMPGRRVLSFDLRVTYNSLDHASDGPLGYGWSHSYDVSLTEAGDDLTLTLGDGSRRYFQREPGTGDYLPVNCRAAGVLDDRSPDGWTYTEPGGVIYELDGNGHLERIHDLAGVAITFSHTTQLDRITDAGGRQVDLAYAAGRLTSVTSPAAPGATAEFSYDGAGNLTSITDARGNSWSFTYDGAHRLLTEHDRRGVLVLTNVYDGDGRIASQRDGLAQLTSFTRTPLGDRTRVDITPPSGHTVSHVYDASHNLMRVTDGEGHTATFGYAANGYPASATDKLGHTTSFTFSDNGLLTQVDDRLGASVHLSHDPNGFLIQTEDELGNLFGAPRDATGNLTWLSNPDGGAGRFWTDGNGETYYLTDLQGRAWQLARNSRGLVATITNPDSKTTAYSYDDAGRVTRMDLPDGLGSLQYTWDEAGNLTAVTAPGDLTTSFTHDEEGNVTNRTFEPTGATTTYAYDALSRLVSITDPLGGITGYGYDADSNLVAVTDPDGYTTRYEYNARNEVVAAITPSGARTSYAHDADGRLVSTTTPADRTWSTTYDAEGRPTSRTDPLGRTTGLLLDASDRDLRVIGPDGDRTLLRFNRMGDLTTTVQADGTVIEQPRTTTGLVTRWTDGRGNTWNLDYDRLGRLAALTDPADGTTSYGYDALGRRTMLRLPSGREINTEYDSAGRLAAMHVLDGADIIFAYGYGPEGQTTTVTEPLGVTILRYDLLGRFVGKTDPFDTSIALSYSAGGRPASVTYPGDLEVGYAYDAGGRLERVTDWLGNLTRYHYDAADRVSRVELPNGASTHYGYDAVGRLESLRHDDPAGATLVSYTIVRDADGRVASLTITGLAPAELDDSLRAASYDAANRTIASSRNLMTSTYRFDTDGRQVERHTGSEVTTYAYDGLGRLQSVADGSHLTTYDLDWEGSRLRRVTDGAETRYLRRGNHLWSAIDATGAALQHYVWAASGIGYQIDAAGGLRVLHTDPAGSVVAITDDAGDLAESYTYDPYGRVLGSSGAGTSELRYLGGSGVISDDTGLLETGARIYDPEARRFLTEDPLGLAASPNLYAYTSGDPVNSVDPSGLQTVAEIAAAESESYIVWGDATLSKPQGWHDETFRGYTDYIINGVKTKSRDIGHFFPSSSGKRMVNGQHRFFDISTVAPNGVNITEQGMSELLASVQGDLTKVDFNLNLGPPGGNGPPLKVTQEQLLNSMSSYPSATYSGQNPPSFLTRLYNGARSRGREILSGLYGTYQVTKVMLTSDAAMVGTLGPESSLLLPAAWGGITGRISSAYIPVTFNETTGKWETADEVVTNYFLPGQLAKYKQKQEDYLWFGIFEDSIGCALDDGLKSGAPVK